MLSSKTPFLVFGLLFSIGVGVFAATSFIQGEIGANLKIGSFSPSGNAGKITLMSQVQSSNVGIPGVTLEGDNTNAYLKGNFFLQTVGYVSLDRSSVQVIPPTGADKNLTLPWQVEGYAWSDNAGWITLGSLNPSTYSGVYYMPTTGSFTGIAWSNTLGYIDFSGNNSSGSEIIARVKVIGNAGGLSSFDSAFVDNNGLVRTSSVLTPFINNVRKNVSLLTRNAPDTVINTAINTQKSLDTIVYYKLANGGSVSLSSVTSFCANASSPRALIVDGGDILIDRDVTGSTKSCSLIALSNGTTGGNIFISDIPKNVYSFLIAEGSVYAGTSLTNLYNDTKVKLANLPASQLYILGGIISRNTIGGATTTKVAAGACPYTVTTCDRDAAIKYDFNFFRGYTKNPANRAYVKNDSLEGYSFIIEFDARASGDMPPGF